MLPIFTIFVLIILFGWLKMASYCDSPFDGDADTHDIDLMNELEKQIYVASVTLETANNKPTGEEAEKEILSDIEEEKKYCFGHCSCRIPKKMYAKFRRCGDCF